MDLILVRHPETTYNAAANRYCGRTDAPLSEKGHEQVAALAHHFQGVALSAVWSSPLSRARVCAEAIAHTKGLPVRTSDDFIEFDFGEWEGLRPQEIDERYADLWKRWNEAHPFAAPPGGELPVDVYARVVRGLRQMTAEYSGKETVLLVAHDQVIRMTFTFFLGMPFYQWRQLGQPKNGSICRVRADLSRGSWHMVSYSQVI